MHTYKHVYIHHTLFCPYEMCICTLIIMYTLILVNMHSHISKHTCIHLYTCAHMHIHTSTHTCVRTTHFSLFLGPC